jgi:hypothetical protein
LIAVNDYRPNHHMDLIMDGHQSRAVALLVPEEMEIHEPPTTAATPAELE